MLKIMPAGIIGGCLFNTHLHSYEEESQTMAWTPSLHSVGNTQKY